MNGNFVLWVNSSYLNFSASYFYSGVGILFSKIVFYQTVKVELGSLVFQVTRPTFYQTLKTMKI